MELIVGALVAIMDEDEPEHEMRRSDIDEALAARCAAL